MGCTSSLVALWRLVLAYGQAETPPSFAPEALAGLDPAAPPPFSAAMRHERDRLSACGEWPR